MCGLESVTEDGQGYVFDSTIDAVLYISILEKTLLPFLHTVYPSNDPHISMPSTGGEPLQIQT